MNSNQPMVMANHPQIAYAAQQTASHFAQRFNENNTSNTNSSMPQNQETNSNKRQEGIPIAQKGLGSANFYPVTAGANGQMYYQNIVYAPQNIPTAPKKMEECGEMNKIAYIIKMKPSKFIENF